MIVPIAVAGSLPASTLLAQRGGFEGGCGPGDCTLRVVLQGLLSATASGASPCDFFGDDEQAAIIDNSAAQAMTAGLL